MVQIVLLFGRRHFDVISLGGIICYCLMVRFFFGSKFVGCHMNYMTIKRVEGSA